MLMIRRPRPASATRASLLENLEGRLLMSVAEPNNSFDTAVTPSDDFYLDHHYAVSDAVSAGDTDDYFKFYNLYGKSNLYAVASGLTSDADLYVYDANRNL